MRLLRVGTRVAPYSIASAAKCASDERFPPVPSGSRIHYDSQMQRRRIEGNHSRAASELTAEIKILRSMTVIFVRTVRVSSSSSRASATARALSQRNFCSVPSANVCWTKSRLSALLLVRPSRLAEFGASLNDSRRSFIAVRIRDSISGSRVTVVRIRPPYQL